MLTPNKFELFFSQLVDAGKVLFKQQSMSTYHTIRNIMYQVSYNLHPGTYLYIKDKNNCEHSLVR